MRVHWLDKVFAALFMRPGLFPDGWGAEERLRHLSQPEPTEGEEEVLSPAWSRPERRLGFLRRRARFPSPAAELLPAGATQEVHVEWWSPPAPRPARTCLLLASAGEEGFGRRRALAMPLLRSGLGVMFLENPYYGLRRPRGQSGTLLATVADQLAMNRATVREAKALLTWLRGQGHGVGVSGYSMGGYTTVLTATRCAFPLAVVPCAAGLSPRPVFVEGLLSRSLRWDALGEGGRERLGELLGRVRDHVARAPRPAVAILVAPTADGIVFPSEVRALAEAWPQAELRWVPGGHLSGYLRGQPAMRRAIRDAMARL